METQLRNRLIELVVDKGLLALLLLLASLLFNQSLEKYKLAQAQRIADTTDFVKASADLWTLVYNYESCLGELDTKRSSRLFAEINPADDDAREQKIAALERNCNDSSVAFNKAMHERRFVIGDGLYFYFQKYMGILASRSEAREQSRTTKSPAERKISDEYVDATNQMLATMRFSASAARGLALSRVP